MGFKDWVSKQAEAGRQYRAAHANDVQCYCFLLTGDVVKYGSKSWPVSEVEVAFIPGDKKSRMTLTRIGTGAALAGPIGVMVGAMSKKDTTKDWLIVSPKGEKPVKVQLPKGHSVDAQVFVQQVEQRQAALAE